MTSLDELIARIEKRRDDAYKRADDYRGQAFEAEHEAECCEAELRGIEAARTTLQPLVEDSKVIQVPFYENAIGLRSKVRRKRRDIRGMVRGLLPELGGMGIDQKVRTLAERLQCRPAQVFAALKALG